MAKATLTLPTGATVVIEGSTEEVEDLIRRMKDEHSRNGGKSKKSSVAHGSNESKVLRDFVLELREAGLFDEQQGLADVKKALASEGHIVPITTLSGVMLRLVKDHELRRLMDKKVWRYVKR